MWVRNCRSPSIVQLVVVVVAVVDVVEVVDVVQSEDPQPPIAAIAAPAKSGATIGAKFVISGPGGSPKHSSCAAFAGSLQSI